MIPLSDNTMRRIGFGVIAVTMALAVTYVALRLSSGLIREAAEGVILATAFLTVTALSIRAVPRNGAVWALIWAAFFGVGGQAGLSIAESRNDFTGEQIQEGLVALAPADLDWLAAAGLAVSLAFWVPAGFLLVNHLLILFPGGSAVSARWRRVAWASGLSMVAVVTTTLLRTAPWVDTPYDVIYQNDMGAAGVFSVLIMVLMAVALAALVSLVRRYRRSSGEERLQYRWVLWGVGFQMLTIFLFGFLPDPAADLLATFALAAIPLSFGIAITKYRLFDIDLVISKSLLFIGLAGFITAIYAGVVVGIGALIGGSSLRLSIVATALVVVVFEPVRSRMQRWVNRLVYGQRATPYEVLSDLTGRLAATESEDGLLDRMALRLAEGTGADRAVVWVSNGSGFLATSSEPPDEQPRDRCNDLGAIPGTAVAIEHDGATLGALSVEKRRGETLTPTELRLVEDLAGSAALLMQRLRLDAELEHAAQDLAESRRRLVHAQDIERRRLERDLNEGATQHVLAVKLELAQAAKIAREEGSDTVAALVAQMTREAQDAIDQIRALAHGIYPPLLETEGLPAAVRGLAELTPFRVEVTSTVAGRYPLPIEAAAYFAISEALTNASKHAADPITITLSDPHAGLTFEVTDSGPGFDQLTVRRGAGLANMTDRLDALGGQLTILSRPGSTTTIAGRLPVAAQAAV